MLDTPGMLIRMAKRSARLASASTIWEDCGLRLSRSGDRSVRGAEHSDVSAARASELFPRFLAAVRSFTRASRADVQSSFSSSKSSLRAGRASNSSMAPMRARIARIQAIGLRQLAGRLGEAARLERGFRDLDERNASDAQRAFDGAR